MGEFAPRVMKPDAGRNLSKDADRDGGESLDGTGVGSQDPSSGALSGVGPPKDQSARR